MTAGPKVSNAKVNEYLTNSDKPNSDLAAKVGSRRLKAYFFRILRKVLVTKVLERRELCLQLFVGQCQGRQQPQTPPTTPAQQLTVTPSFAT